MPIDSYKFLPRSMKQGYEAVPVIDEPPVWAPLPKPLRQCTIALMTSAGVYLKDSQEPFDAERERREPTWGDPTFRVIPADVRQEQIGATHLHLNTDDILQDVNVVLPFRAFKQLEAEGAIGALAHDNYSFMGYQDRRNEDWRTVQGPELVRRLTEQSVDVLLLAPA
jgi:D-proline reductase (dithiol) PrdB